MNNFWYEVAGLFRSGIPLIIVNRAYIIVNILEKYPKIVGKIEIKDKKVCFLLNNQKTKLTITIDNPSWLTYKWGRKKAEGVLLNRRYLLPLFEVLNGVDDE